MKNIISTIIFILFSLSLNSQVLFAPNSQKLEITAQSTDTPIRIDGQLNEVAWQTADSISDFIQIEPNQGIPTQFSTSVKILSNSETFAVGIDGFLDERNTITLAVNPYGSQKDYLSFDDTFFDSDWNGLWKVRTSITDLGWYAEFRIPWKTIRYAISEKDSEQWGINFVRRQRKSNEIAAWSPYPRSFGFNRAEYFGILKGFKPPKPKKNIRINPYLTNNFLQVKQNGNQILTDNKVTVGGELKWAINPYTLFDATINTDFAQADADEQVNNTSRFSIFFPEKRQFFLENASLFGTGLYDNAGTSGNIIIAPFFSRRIGLAVDGTPLNIDGGLRLVNQSTRSNFGLMAIQEQDTNLSKRYNFVGRYSKNFGKQNRIGFITTTRIGEENTNVVGGLDGFFRLGKAHSLGFMALLSHDTDLEQQGLGGYLQYQYTTNQLSSWWTTSVLDKDFNPALGFISRQNIIANAFGTIFNYRGERLPFKKKIRAFLPRITANWYISVGNYQNTRYNFNMSTDASNKISVIFNYELGDFFNGKLVSRNISLNLSPIPQIFLTANLNSNRLSKFGENKVNKTINLYTLKSRLFINPRLSFVGLYQYNSQNKSNFFNLRFAWEYSPLSYCYLVYNSNTLKANFLDELQTNQAIVKISFLKQF